MSENLKLVRSILANTERGEFLVAAEWADPEIEWVIVDGPTAGTWTGVAGMAESARTMISAFEDLRVYAETTGSSTTSASSCWFIAQAVGRPVGSISASSSRGEPSCFTFETAR
jgi:hypothetical protein